MTATRTAALFAVALAAASLTGFGGDEAPAPQCTVIADDQAQTVVPCDDLEIEDGPDTYRVPSTKSRKRSGGSGAGSSNSRPAPKVPKSGRH